MAYLKRALPWYNTCPARSGPSIARMTADHGQKVQELEAVLALCKSAPYIQSLEVAEKLLSRLSPYLVESYAQILTPSPSLRAIQPSPYEALTHSLASAVLTLGLQHNTLRTQAVLALTNYLSAWTTAATELSADLFDGDDHEEFDPDGGLARVITQSLSLLGFLSASAEHVHFWNAYDRLQLVQDVRSALTEQFLIAFETALSIARNARSHQHGLREWKRYAKQYAASGRPLGAMIIHDSFLGVAVASASLLVCDSPSANGNISFLEHIGSTLSAKRHQPVRDTATDSLADGLTKIAAEEMERLDNDLDYLQKVGSAWQQRQGSSVKAKILTTYLCCTVYDEDIADDEILTAWLDNVLNDPVQSADHELASTVLQSMAILARVSPELASTLGRSLPRIIVQGNFDQRTTSVAAESLAAVLSLLPQDAIITTLYSLGNIISVAAPVADRTTAASPTLNGSGRARGSSGLYDHQHGSAISLTPSDIEEPHHVHTVVIETIVSVARNCKDAKITALALSMLVQKVGRSSKAVDAKIVTDSAFLGIHSPAGEFRSLLKVYSRLIHDALVKDDTIMVEAVRLKFRSLVSYSPNLGHGCTIKHIPPNIC